MPVAITQCLRILYYIQGFQETVKDKITEWEGEISHSAGISNDMQLRYENARRKSLAKMAALLIENQKKVRESIAYYIESLHRGPSIRCFHSNLPQMLTSKCVVEFA